MDVRATALPADELDDIWSRGVDDFGNSLVVTENQGAAGAPLRCCQAVGEQVALLAFRPSTVGGAYAEVGPVFVHADCCPGWSGTGYPDGFRHRRQLLRAYDRAGRQVDNVIVEPEGAVTGIESLLTRQDVAFLHRSTRTGRVLDVHCRADGADMTCVGTCIR